MIYRPQAVADVQHAFNWYERQRPGLGDEFLAELASAERLVQETPNAFRVIHRETRRCLLHRFPYQLLYRIAGDVVVVVGCLHIRRSPNLARRRLNDRGDR
jgi:plasmid stabilization system protein ParE